VVLPPLLRRLQHRFSCGALPQAEEHREPQTLQQVEEMTSSVEPRPHQFPYYKKVLLISVPAAFDMLATGLLMTGLLYIPASIFQILRGSSVIYSAIFSVAFLGKVMRSFHWAGVACCLLGVSLVGFAQLENARSLDNSPAEAALGMVMVVMSMSVQAGQTIAEEFLMKHMDLPAMEVVGWEGFFGLLMTLGVTYPILNAIPGGDHGHVNDIAQEFALFTNSEETMMLCLLMCFTGGVLNVSGISVTAVLSGVHREMLDATRTLVVWLFGLVVHYLFDPRSQFGERWSPQSYLEFLGFALLVLGQLIYSGLIQLPFAVARPDRSETAIDLEEAQTSKGELFGVEAKGPLEDGVGDASLTELEAGVCQTLEMAVAGGA